MSLARQAARNDRAATARIVVFALLGALVAVFFRAQVIRHSDWSPRAESNRMKASTLQPPRGAILDRNGRALAQNVPGYSVWIGTDVQDSMRVSLDRLQGIAKIDASRVDRARQEIDRGAKRPILVSTSISFDEVAAIEERRADFPRILIEMRPMRRYPAGVVGAHVVGRVGEISSSELDMPEYVNASPGLAVGRTGLEAQYDTVLQGIAGVRYQEVDAAGRFVGAFGGVRRIEAQPGRDIRTHLDIELMEWIHHVFPQDRSGAVVVLDVATGGVLAMYSAPAYDPNVFTAPLAPGEWQRLTEDEESPLFNRAVAAKYPPGSPMKLVSALVALEAGVLSPDERMPVSCRGSYRYGDRTWRCWNAAGHGSLTLADAIKHSCNVFFYQVGTRVGLQRMIDRVNQMQISRRCGVDLPGEADGTYPDGLDYWRRTSGYAPGEGEVLNLVIGQGPIEQTPLMVARYFLAIARDGSAPSPTVYIDAPVRQDVLFDTPDLHLEVVREGLRRVTESGGTAYLSSLEHFDVMGKTGTAQSNPGQPNHAWFGAISGLRGGAPEVVVVALVEFGDSGSGVAAPLAAKTADFYLRGVHGIPRDTVQTLGEHLRSGRRAPWAAPRESTP